MKNKLNWYVLYCQTQKVETICENFKSKKEIFAFVPRIEEHMRYQEEYVIKPLFPGYLFIKSFMDQGEFDTYLKAMREEKYGVIRELKKQDVSALTDDEIKLLDQLLDEDYVLRMSEGKMINGRASVYKGPLQYFEENIISLDKRNRLAYLNIMFLDRNIKAGLYIKQNAEM